MTTGPGLTPGDLVGQDFIQVRPALIRRLKGDAAAAVVLQRIAWRAEWHGEERDGHVWYRASFTELGDDTGLSRDQINRLVKKLRTTGFIEGRALDAAAGDQTLWYRLVFSDGSRTQMVTREPRRPDQQKVKSPRSRRPVDNPVTAQVSDLHVADSPRSQPAVIHRGGIATVTVAESPSLLSLETSRDKYPPTPGADAPGECRRHVDKPGVNCRSCGTNPRAQRPAVQGTSRRRPVWCRSCDEGTRLVDTVDGGVVRCAVCHPREVAPWDY
jgi:hypothetical protein